MAQRRSWLKPMNSDDGDDKLTMTKAFYPHAPEGLWRLKLKVGCGDFPAGKSWSVVLADKQVDDPQNPLRKVFTQGWDTLYKDLQLKRKDVLLFEKVGRWEFDITVFSKAYTLKMANESLFKDFNAQYQDISSDDSEDEEATRIDLTDNMASRICINKDWLYANEMHEYKYLVLRDERDDKWPVNLDKKKDERSTSSSSSERYYIGKGWNNVWKAWKLKAGKVVILRHRLHNEVMMTVHDAEDTGGR